MEIVIVIVEMCCTTHLHSILLYTRVYDGVYCICTWQQFLFFHLRNRLQNILSIVNYEVSSDSFSPAIDNDKTGITEVSSIHDLTFLYSFSNWSWLMKVVSSFDFRGYYGRPLHQRTLQSIQGVHPTEKAPTRNQPDNSKPISVSWSS